MTYLIYYLCIGFGFFCGSYAGNVKGINETTPKELLEMIILSLFFWPLGLTWMWSK